MSYCGPITNQHRLVALKYRQGRTPKRSHALTETHPLLPWAWMLARPKGERRKVKSKSGLSPLPFGSTSGPR